MTGTISADGKFKLVRSEDHKPTKARSRPITCILARRQMLLDVILCYGIDAPRERNSMHLPTIEQMQNTLGNSDANVHDVPFLYKKFQILNSNYPVGNNLKDVDLLYDWIGRTQREMSNEIEKYFVENELIKNV